MNGLSPHAIYVLGENSRLSQLLVLSSIGGVALGVATVILVIAVLDGVEHGLKDRFLSNEAHVVLSLIDQSFFRDYQKRTERIEALDDVVAASPAIWTQTGVFRERTDTIQDVIIIKGIDPVQEEQGHWFLNVCRWLYGLPKLRTY